MCGPFISAIFFLPFEIIYLVTALLAAKSSIETYETLLFSVYSEHCIKGISSLSLLVISAEIIGSRVISPST